MPAWIRGLADRIFGRIHFQITALLLVSILAATLVNGWHGVRFTRKALESAAERELALSVRAEAERLESGLAGVAADLRFLLAVPPSSGMFRSLANDDVDPLDGSTTEQWIRRGETIFRGLADARPDYRSIRLLDADGGVLMSVDRERGNVAVTPAARRTTATAGSGFRDILGLSSDQTYVSDLGRARGSDGQPVEPRRTVVRYGVPVFAGELDPIGALTVEVDVTPALEGLRERGSHCLLDSEGVCVLHPDPSREWGDVHAGGMDTSPGERSGVIRSGSEFLAFASVHALPGSEDQPWKLIRSTPRGEVMAVVERHRMETAGILVVSLLLAATLGSMLGRRMLVTPLQKSVQVAQDVVDGDLTAHLDVNRRDELGQLAGSLNRMVVDLRSNMGSIKGNASALNAASETLNSFAEEMVAGSRETASQANAASDASTRAKERIDAVATAAEQMNGSISEISAKAHEATHVIDRAVSLAAGTTQMVDRLGASSTEVGEIVKLIDSITEQTNLLALNATIEAARAGAAGKGFTVVASEVKNLANETVKATADISAKIETIQTDIREVVGAIGQIGEIIHQVNDFHVVIAGAVAEQSASTQEMTSNISGAAAATTEIARNVSGVASVASRTSDGAGATQQAVQELTRMARDLEALVARFRA